MKYILILVLSIGFSITNFAQVTTQAGANQDSTKIIEILSGDRLRYQKVDSLTELQMVAGNVKFREGKTIFTCDSCSYNKSKKVLEAFGNVHINDADSVQTHSDYLIYYTDKRLAVLKKNVSLSDGKGILTTNELQYETQEKIGTYVDGGKVVTGKTVLTSQEATYYGDLKDVYFKKNVKMIDPQQNVYADSLLYNTDTQIATFISKTLIVDSSKRTITTSEGFYNMKSKTAFFGKRPVIKDKGVQITGDDISFDDNSGESYARGNAVYIDSAQGVSILANDMRANKKKNTFQATQHPLMIIKQEKDSTFVTADTLFSARLTDLPGYAQRAKTDTLRGLQVLDPKDSTNRNRYFQAYHHVRIFSDSLQGVSDSLFYSGVDSVFRMYTNPVLWSVDKQVTGDTIYLFTKNRHPERMQVFENAMVVNKVGPNYYNQLKGTTINAFFHEGEIDFIRSKGSAESIYYATDEDNAFVGVNKSSADVIDMYFVEKSLNKVVYRNAVTGITYPFRQAKHDELRLRGFKWLESRRPKTKFELFEDPVVLQQQIF